MDSENKIYDVKTTATAREQLMDHARFLSDVSTNAASKLVDDFDKGSITLKQMPERCPWLVHDAIPFQKYRKLLFSKYHMALFQIRGNIVYITAVVDCRQDYSWLL